MLFVIVSNELQFELDGFLNKQNWGVENPHEIVEKPMHPQKVTVWCGLGAGGIISPYFFKNGPGNAVTVNGDRNF